MKFGELKKGDNLHTLIFDSENGGPRYTMSVVSEIKDLIPGVAPSLTSLLDKNFGIMTLKINIDGEEVEFEKVRTEDDYFSGGKYRVTLDKEKLYKEVNNLKEEKQNHINNYEKYKKIVQDCEETLQELGFVDFSANSIKEIKGIKEDINKIEEKVTSLTKELEKLTAILSAKN